MGSAPRPRARSERAGTVLAWILGGSLLALFVLPLVALFLVTPLSSLEAAFASPEVWTSLGFTAYASLVALAISLVLGVPLGYVLARHSFRGRAVVESLVNLPIVLPHLVVGLALLALFAPNSPLGGFLVGLGFPVVGTIAGVIAVMVYVSAPYTVLASELAFRALDPKLSETARCLGATPRRVLTTVSLPLASRGILTGALLTWARSVSEIGGFLILAYLVYPSGIYQGPVTNPISVYVYNLYQAGFVSSATAVAAVLVLIAFAIFLSVRLVERSGRLPWARGALGP